MNRNKLKKSSFRCRRKLEYPEKNLRKQVWTGNQMDIQRRDRESNPGPVVHSAEEVPLLYLLPIAQ